MKRKESCELVKIDDTLGRWYNLSEFHSNEDHLTYFLFNPREYKVVDGKFSITGYRFFFETPITTDDGIMIDDIHEMTITDDVFNLWFAEENVVPGWHAWETIHTLLDHRREE